MTKNDIPYYNDPEDFETLGDKAKFPCNTQYMIYNPLLHRYFLTSEGLLYYGIDAERKYISDNANKIEEIIQKTSKKVYDVINYKAGISRYQVMLYRIATAPKTIYPDQYVMRKQFEEALADQARFIVENGDGARFSTANNMESDMPMPPPRPEDSMRNLSDIAPETLRTLDALNLTKWFAMGQNYKPDLTKY